MINESSFLRKSENNPQQLKDPEEALKPCLVIPMQYFTAISIYLHGKTRPESAYFSKGSVIFAKFLWKRKA